MIVVVLGQRLSSGEIHPQLQARVDAGLAAFRSTNASHLIFSGGRTNRAISYAECEVMKEYAIEQGIDPDRILTEDQSRDTIGNAYFTRLLVEELPYAPETIILVTSTYHADRSKYIFEQCFGDEYHIDTSSAVETVRSHEETSETRSMEQARAFFEPIAPGDIAAIRQRLNEVHEYYTFDVTAPV